jgi:hypothetical protein
LRRRSLGIGIKSGLHAIFSIIPGLAPTALCISAARAACQVVANGFASACAVARTTVDGAISFGCVMQMPYAQSNKTYFQADQIDVNRWVITAQQASISSTRAGSG